MKHIGEFYSLDGRLWRIEIQTPGSGADKTLSLSGDPFTASISGEDKNLYTPIRCGGATIGLLTDSYEPQFYTGNATGIPVRLLEMGKDGVHYQNPRVEWTGYITPTMYDQSFDHETEELQLDCVDGIAVLKDIPFRQEEKQLMTLLDIIAYCLRASGCYAAFNISDNVQLTAAGTESVIEKFRISSSNFFGKRDDPEQTDDDIAWSCYDVLAEIVQWLGYTLTVEGDEVWIVDYDSLRSGRNTYFRYPLSGTGRPTASRRTSSYSHQISSESFGGTGTKLSLDKVCNKVTVKDDFNTFDNLFPAFGDIAYENNITAYLPGETNNTLEYLERGMHGMTQSYYVKDTDNTSERTRYFWEVTADWRNRYYVSIWQFYDSPVFRFHKYAKNAAHEDVTDSPMWEAGNTVWNMLNYNGAFYARLWIYEIGSRDDYYKAWAKVDEKSFNTDTEREESLAKFVGYNATAGSVSMKPYIIMTNTYTTADKGNFRFGPGDGIHFNAKTDNETTFDEIQSYPYISLKDKSTSAIFGGKGHYLRIKGTFRFHDEWRTPHPLGGNGKSLTRHGDYKDDDEGFIWCKVRWGDHWWNGDDWQGKDCWFKLYFYNKAMCSSKGMSNERNYDADFDFLPSKMSGLSLGVDGYCIPCPSDGNLDGAAEVAFAPRDMHGRSKGNNWSPSGSKTDNRYSRYMCNCVFLSDLEITAEVSDGFLSQEDLDSDTCYTNVINGDYVEKSDDVTFRVCTDDGKRPSYSSVDYLDGSSSRYVAATYNKALANAEKGTVGDDGLNGCLRQEEHTVFKMASQYSEPRVTLECTLHNDGHLMTGTYSSVSLPGRVFVCTGREVDYRYNTCKIKILEKPLL